MRQQGTAEALVRAGADPNAPRRGGRTPNAAAPPHNPPRALVNALRDGGARADMADDDGWNAVQLAASAGSIELLELFGRRRARLDATDGRIAPALWIAAENGNIDAARALLRGGASPRLRWDGRSPLDIARARRNARLLALMQMR
jgi:ankyrin repeat protein